MSSSPRASILVSVGVPASAPAVVVTATANPLCEEWPAGALGLPPFSRVTAEHFAPAFAASLECHLAEVGAIAGSAEAPTFVNTVRAFDRCGLALERVSRVLDHLCASATTPALQAVELEMAPRLAAHESKIMMLPGLFERVDTVHAARGELAPEAARLTERTWLRFVRAGARLDPAGQAAYARVVEELSTLTTTFSQNVLKDEEEFVLDLAPADLEGCPADLVGAARAAAAERGRGEGALLITLSRSLVEPFLTFCPRRELRERAWRAWTRRGELSAARDNKPLIAQILRLRAEQARLHGYASFAEWQLSDTMAATPARVAALLEKEVWPRARAAAERERAALEAFSGVAPLEPWDWRFFAERLRAKEFAFDDAELKPYFSLPRMQAAAFDVAGRLFGVRFVRVPDARGYHPDVECFEVKDAGGETVGLFCADNFARPGKRGGAWMSELRTGSNDGERVLPLVFNNNNFSRGGDGKPALLSVDDATTLFHEFGHGLHGLLTRATYKGLAGTNVLRDWVELPSQLFEHWLLEPEVLRAHARHVDTGEPVPEALLAKLKAAKDYGAGFAATEYTSCALIDQELYVFQRQKSLRTNTPTHTHTQTPLNPTPIYLYKQAHPARSGAGGGF
jgi:peptidyl-dipeptidase Dcp